LHSYVHGLRKDPPAMMAGLSLPHSNEPIEGANTKVKLLNRQMYARAGFELLRQRIRLSWSSLTVPQIVGRVSSSASVSSSARRSWLWSRRSAGPTAVWADRRGAGAGG
jgi:hypothetical protein